VSAAGYEIARAGETPVRITARYAAELYREARGNEAAKLNGDLDGGFTYLSAIGERTVTPVREDGEG
jgi:hypothetical protein